MIVSVIIFLIFVSVLFYANKKETSSTASVKKLKLSIIIAAKNEEQNIPALITSLTKQNYSAENFEVIIVDDNSTDDTYTIAEAKTLNFNNFKILRAEEKRYSGKRGALQIGIENAKHPHILITDADCKPERNWINEFAKKFNEGYDFIFGIAPYKQTKSLVNKIACFENLRTHILTFAFANIDLPYSAAARSFGFKKKSFLNLEGYKNTTDTLSGDDDLLLREAVKNKMKITTVTEPDAFVFSQTQKNFAGYLKQKARHTSTANYYSLKIKLLLALWHLLNIAFLLSPLLMLIDLHFGIFFIVKLAADFITVKLLMKKFGYRFNSLEIIFLQLIYEILLIVHYINGTFGKRKW